MICYNCRKNFDYDKFYGICPKCGCFNKKVTEQEAHQEYHDTYDGGYQHREEPEKKPETKAKGKGLFIAGLIFMLFSLTVMVLVPVILSRVNESRREQGRELEVLPVTEHEMGEEFSYKETFLCVKECRTLENPELLADLEEGKKLVAVRIYGRSDGEYEDYNRVEEPYLAMGGTYRKPISNYTFEPYSRIFGLDPMMDPYQLLMEAEAEGWYVFLTDEEDTDGQICFEVYEEARQQGKLLQVEAVNIRFEEVEVGGVQNEE